MQSAPKVGHQHTRTFVVGPEHLITFADARMPAVLSTPNLIAQLEYAARDLAAEFLQPHERTVGVEVDIKHLAPALEGATVTCTARVLGVEDGLISFQVEASDAIDLLARGLHRRRVVDADRLKRRIEKKRAAMK